MTKSEMSGRSKGGVARAEKLDANERRAIAKKGALTRAQNADVVKATHVGELKIGDLIIPCAVLPDGTRVLSQRGVGRAIGRGYGSAAASTSESEDGGVKVPYFLAANSLKPFIPNDLLVVLLEPVRYRHGQGGGVAHGIKAGALPGVCNVWLQARQAGVLNKPQLAVAQRVEILMRGLAQVGIDALIDEATGYQAVRDKDALQKILEQYVRKELAAWAKRFPDEFYEQVYRLRGWEWKGMGTNRISACANYTRDLVYERIAPGLIKTLEERNPVQQNGRRKGAHHQLLTEEVGVPELARHFGSVVTLAKISRTWEGFYALVNEIHPKRGDSLHLPLTGGGNQPELPLD